MKKVMIITGTSRGIGRYLAEYYIQNGYIVSGCSRGEGTIKNKNYLHFAINVFDEDRVVDMIKTIENKYGRVDVLINNAGIASMNHIITTPLTTSHEIFNVNFFGTFIFLREVSKIMVKSKKGCIINFATVATPLRLEGESIYAASKAAVVSLTEISARELAPFNITVNAIGPTPVPTDLIKNVPQRKIDALLDRQAIKRFGKMEDITNIIDFFISEKSNFITGQIIYLGGIAG
jgi:3-oxoacyl-[acyl-carrier protein] reductase